MRVAPEPLLAREALFRLRAEAAGFEREVLPEARDEPLRAVPPPERELLALAPEPDPFAVAFEPEPFDELRLPRELRDAGLLVAISHPFRRGQPCPGWEYPPFRAVTKHGLSMRAARIDLVSRGAFRYPGEGVGGLDARP